MKKESDVQSISEFPSELKARLTFRTGAHEVAKTTDEIAAQTEWQCCARNGGPACSKEGPAETMKVAVTSDGTILVLCPSHAVALHKEGQARGKRINTLRTLAEYLDNGILEELRDRDKLAERHWRAAQEVADLVDEF